MANSVAPDQTAPLDLGLHCLPRPVCPKTSEGKDHNSKFKIAVGTKHHQNMLMVATLTLVYNNAKLVKTFSV